MDVMTKIWDHIFKEELQVDPSQYPVLQYVFQKQLFIIMKILGFTYLSTTYEQIFSGCYGESYVQTLQSSGSDDL